MKKTLITLLLIGTVAAAPAAEPTLESVQKELTLTKAQLELAEAKLALAAKERELARLAQSLPDTTERLALNTVSIASARTHSSEVSAAVLERAQGLELETRLKTHARAALKKVGQEKWDALSPVQKDFLAGPAGRTAHTNLENFTGMDKSDSFYVSVALAQKKALGTATVGDEAAAGDEQEEKPADKPADQAGDTPAKKIGNIDEAIFFRNAGISFSPGYGVIRQSGNDRSVGTLIARWNVRQAEATYWYNNLTAQGAATGYKAVPYYGMDRTQFVGWYEKAHGQPVSDAQSWLTAWGPFIGGTVTGEKVDLGSGEERPYLAGLSFGFGFSTEAASLFYVDVGTTISPKQGFKSNKLYVGFSADAELLAALWGNIRGKK